MMIAISEIAHFTIEEYQQRIEFSASETVSPLDFPDIAIAVSAIFAI